MDCRWLNNIGYCDRRTRVLLRVQPRDTRNTYFIYSMALRMASHVNAVVIVYFLFLSTNRLYQFQFVSETESLTTFFVKTICRAPVHYFIIIHDLHTLTVRITVRNQSFVVTMATSYVVVIQHASPDRVQFDNNNNIKLS
jgi:hypothetical protein